MARARTWLFALCVTGVLAACMTDHSALEKPPSGHVAGGAAGSGGQGGFFVVISGGSSSSSVGGTTHRDDEAPGTNVLTVVHGVVDAPSVLVCFAKVSADGTVAAFGAPLTGAPIAYGAGVALHELAGADFAGDFLQPFVIAGDFTLIDGLDCASALDRAEREEAAVAPEEGAASGGASGARGMDPSLLNAAEDSAAGAGGVSNDPKARLRASFVPAIPAGTLNGGRSYLLVLNGCIGGSGYDARNSEQYCGAGYSEQAPTLSALLVALSRKTAFDKVGMQAVHASLATGTITISSQSQTDMTVSPVSIVNGEIEGELAPRPAATSGTAFDYGSARSFILQVQTDDGSMWSAPWWKALALGNVSALVDGSTYALVLIGPRIVPDASPGAALWNPPALTLVPADLN